MPEYKYQAQDSKGKIIKGKADSFYIPNKYITKLFDLFDTMYKFKIFLECAFPISIGSLLLPKYQLIYFNPLEKNEERKKVINFLYKNYNQITIHPIKFSNDTLQNKVKE